MCGVFWIKILSEGSDIYKTAFEKIRHRGPDGSYFEVFGDNALGFHHLAIFLPAKPQPLVWNKHRMVCNGEIYNYKKFSQTCESDVEVLFQALKGDTSEFLRSVSGDFACIWVTEDGEVMAARDPTGVSPLYYGIDKSGTVVGLASEAKALLGLPFIRQIKRFPPGHWWSSRKSPDGFVPYSDIYTGIPFCDPVNAVHELVSEAAVKRLTHGDRPVAVLCSGGLDSSILACIAHQIKPDIHAFSVTFRDREGQCRGEDLFYAKSLLQKLGIEHTIVEFTADDAINACKAVVEVCETDDPITVRAAIPMYLLARYISENTDIKVIVGGEAADECFMGYSYFEHSPGPKAAAMESIRLIQNIHSFDLLRAERCFSAHGLEVRVPYLDKDLLKYVLSLDGELRLPQNNEEKGLLRQAFSHFSPLREARVLDRPKQRLSDGVSFSYVPSLLRHWSGTDLEGQKAVGLDVMESREREKYTSFLLQGLIPDSIPRSLPNWQKADKGYSMGFQSSSCSAQIGSFSSISLGPQKDTLGLYGLDQKH